MKTIDFYIMLPGNIEARGSQKGRKKNYGSGKETLRFKANGQTQIMEEVRTRFLQYQV